MKNNSSILKSNSNKMLKCSPLGKSRINIKVKDHINSPTLIIIIIKRIISKKINPIK